MKIKGKLNTLAGLNISNHEEKKITNCKRSKISGLDLLHKTTMESINGKNLMGVKNRYHLRLKYSAAVP